MLLNQSQSSRMVSNNNERRYPNRRRIVALVSPSTAAAIILVFITLFSTAHPSAHALVAPSASPQHRSLRRIPPSPFDRSSPTFHIPTKPEPRGDRTVRCYIDEWTGAAECIDVGAELAIHPVELTAPPPVSPPRHPILRLFHAGSTLRAQVKTIKKNDRQLYFNFVVNKSLDANLMTGSTKPTGLVLCLFRAWCALRAQVKTTKKNDRQLYFNFVENNSLAANRADPTNRTC